MNVISKASLSIDRQFADFYQQCPIFVSGCPNIDSGLSGKSCSLKIYKKRDVLKLSSRFNRGINMELQGRIAWRYLSGVVIVIKGLLSSLSFAGSFTVRFIIINNLAGKLLVAGFGRLTVADEGHLQGEVQ
ncbi:hypothetical protein [Aliikangiella coralliicola]|uniref:Uncharacterized protein n=1 Tax=Aliikangiella coralliicola TaxID=2592383 RepID=A0A545U6K0_9GAMM|nr:hypothetical protein [Aliikangiella coralliicola]TQV85087.1 hypothetical protein FLL46_22115 [Aliikangiella coralliicola]